MIYLYGLASGNFERLQDLTAEVQGLQGPVRVAPAADWNLLYSDHDDAEILPKRRLLLRHTQVLEHVLPHCTLLPARFGLVATDVSQVTALTRDSAEDIRAEMAKVAGAVELGVRVSFPKDAALLATLQAAPKLQAEQAKLRHAGPEAHFAMAAFGERLADQLDRRRGAAQKALITALRPLVRDHVLRRPEDDSEVLRAEFLLDAEAQEVFQDKVAQAAAQLDFADGAEPRVQIVGPVPMYHFVGLNLAFDVDQEAA